MIVTKIEELDKKKCKIYIDEEFAFTLYRSEVRKYEILLDGIMEEAVYNTIIKDVLLKRARERALYLLQSMDKTEAQLRDKLRQNGYPFDVIDLVISELISYRYVDDKRYVEQYIYEKQSQKSKKQLVFDLIRKGIPKEVIQTVLEQTEIDDSTALETLIRKKLKGLDLNSKPDLSKVYSYLFRKGFTHSEIMSAFKKFEQN